MNDMNKKMQDLIDLTEKYKTPFSKMRELTNTMTLAEKVEIKMGSLRRFNHIETIAKKARDIMGDTKWTHPNIRALMAHNHVYDAMREAKELLLGHRNEFTNSGAAILNNLMPDNALTAIQNVAYQQSRQMTAFQEMQALLRPVSYLTELRDLHVAMRSISGEMATTFTRARRWDLLESFDEFNEEVADLSEELAGKEYVTKEDLERLYELVLILIKKVDGIGKNWFSKMIDCMAIICFAITIAHEPQYWIDKPDAATIQDVEKINQKLLDLNTTLLATEKEYRAINMPCRVQVKPKTKSYTLTSLSKGMPVTVLNTKHEWVYISYLNPDTNLLQAGWILKKYLGGVVKY